MGSLTCLKIAKECSWDKFHFTAKPMVGMCFLQWIECVTAAGLLCESGRSQWEQSKGSALCMSTKAARVI